MHEKSWSLLIVTDIDIDIDIDTNTDTDTDTDIERRDSCHSVIQGVLNSLMSICVVTDAVESPLGNVSINNDRCSAVSTSLKPVTQSDQLPVLGPDSHIFTLKYTHTHTTGGTLNLI